MSELTSQHSLQLKLKTTTRFNNSHPNLLRIRTQATLSYISNGHTCSTDNSNSNARSQTAACSSNCDLQSKPSSLHTCADRSNRSTILDLTQRTQVRLTNNSFVCTYHLTHSLTTTQLNHPLQDTNSHPNLLRIRTQATLSYISNGHTCSTDNSNSNARSQTAACSSNCDLQSKPSSLHTCADRSNRSTILDLTQRTQVRLTNNSFVCTYHLTHSLTTTQLNHPLQHTINSAHINSLSQHLAVTAKSVVTLAFSVVKQGPQILHWESTKLKNCVLQSTKLRIAACNQPNSKLRLAVTSTLFTYNYTLLHYYITAHKKPQQGSMDWLISTHTLQHGLCGTPTCGSMLTSIADISVPLMRTHTGRLVDRCIVFVLRLSPST